MNAAIQIKSRKINTGNYKFVRVDHPVLAYILIDLVTDLVPGTVPVLLGGPSGRQ